MHRSASEPTFHPDTDSSALEGPDRRALKKLLNQKCIVQKGTNVRKLTLKNAFEYKDYVSILNNTEEAW